jgi:hypothetical protein
VAAIAAIAGVTLAGVGAEAAAISWNQSGNPVLLNQDTLGQLITGNEVFGGYYNANLGCGSSCATQTIADTVNSRSLTFPMFQPSELISVGGGFGTASPNTGIAAMDTMVTAGLQGGSGRGGIGLNIPGLTIGTTYDLQVFLWSGNHAQTEQINGTPFTLAASTDPVFVTGSFTADAATETLAFTGGSNNNFSAILVTTASAVP